MKLPLHLLTSPQIDLKSLRITDLPDANVPESERALVIALEREVSAFGAAEVRPVLELAGLDPCFPVRAPELVLEELDAVQPVLDVGPARDDARRVPVANAFQLAP